MLAKDVLIVHVFTISSEVAFSLTRMIFKHPSILFELEHGRDADLHQGLEGGKHKESTHCQEQGT
jgi:hypothetical protein